MFGISTEKECIPGVVNTVLGVKTWIPFFEGAFLPGVYLEDAVRQKTTCEVSIGSGDEKRKLRASLSERKRGSYFRLTQDSHVIVESTRVKVFGVTVPGVRFNRLAGFSW